MDYKNLTELRNIAKQNGIKYINRKTEEELLKELNALEDIETSTVTEKPIEIIEENSEESEVLIELLDEDEDEFETEFSEDLVFDHSKCPEMQLNKSTGELEPRPKTMAELVRETQMLNKQSEIAKDVEMKRNLLRQAKRQEEMREAYRLRYELNKKRNK